LVFPAPLLLRYLRPTGSQVVHGQIGTAYVKLRRHWNWRESQAEAKTIACIGWVTRIDVWLKKAAIAA